MKESYEIMMDKLGKERGKPFFEKLKKLKPKFDKLSYPEKLRFWEEKELELTVSTYHLIEGEKSNEPQNHITIFPNNKEEQQLYFDWYFAHLKNFFPLQYDIEKMIENYNEIINENPQPIYYTEGELKKYQTQFDNYFTTNKTGLARRAGNSFVKGFNSVAKKEIIDFVSSDFTFQNSTLLADGIIAAHFIGFLKEQLHILEEEKTKPKKENSEIDNDILEVRTKLILLNRLGIIKHLQGFEQLKDANELSKFLSEIFETKEENKTKTFETIRTDLRYIDLTPKKNKKSPKTPTQLKKVNATLAKFGFPPINE